MSDWSHDEDDENTRMNLSAGAPAARIRRLSDLPCTPDPAAAQQALPVTLAPPSLQYDTLDALHIYADGSCITDEEEHQPRAGAAACVLSNPYPPLPGPPPASELLAQYSGIQASEPAELVAILLLVRLARQYPAERQVVGFVDCSSALHRFTTTVLDLIFAGASTAMNREFSNQSARKSTHSQQSNSCL